MTSRRRPLGSAPVAGAPAGTSLMYHCLSRVDRVLVRLSRAISWVTVFLILSMIASVCALYSTVLLPQIRRFSAPTVATLHAVASVWLLGNVFFNYVMAVVVGPGHPRRLSPDDSEAGWSLREGVDLVFPTTDNTLYVTTSQKWRWCKICRAPKPPRTHHDGTTNRCVLQMCHYCPAVAQVVGLRNYQHFGRFVLYTWIAGLFTAATCGWLQRRLPAELSKNWQGDAIFFCGVATAAIGVAVGVLAAFHVYLVMSGQTTIEFYENWTARRTGLISNPPFDAGVRANVEAAFGRPYFRFQPWWSVILLPDCRRLATPTWMVYPPSSSINIQLD